MTEVIARPRVFSRGSPVLDYWLAHAEGMTVQPLGAVVERVLVPAPLEPPEALVVRHPSSGRERTIPADAIASVEPAAGELRLVAEARPRRAAVAARYAARAAWSVALSFATGVLVVVRAARWLVRETAVFAAPRIAAWYRKLRSSRRLQASYLREQAGSWSTRARLAGVLLRAAARSARSATTRSSRSSA